MYVMLWQPYLGDSTASWAYVLEMNYLYLNYIGIGWKCLRNNVLKLLLILQRIPIVENVFCHAHKQFHLSYAIVGDPDSSDSSRF